MTGKEWFIVGARLIGLGVGYMGFQHVMTYVTRGMFFSGLDSPFELHPNPSWTLLLNGVINLGFAWLLLIKADTLADWCYGKEKKPSPHDDADREDDPDDWGDEEPAAVPEPYASEKRVTDIPSSIEKKDSLEI